MGVQKDRMLAGDLYQADDPELAADYQRAMALLERFNASPAADGAARRALLAELLGSFGAQSEIRPPLYCDYGTYIHIGRGTFLNYGVTLLDVAPIRIGDDVQIGPHVQLLTATHPIAPGPRRDKWEAAQPITIGNNAWIGGGAIILPGITIGENTVVGAGAIVTRDLPANVVAVGNPARVMREIPHE